jgi:hypothetical protein
VTRSNSSQSSHNRRVEPIRATGLFERHTHKWARKARREGKRQSARTFGKEGRKERSGHKASTHTHTHTRQGSYQVNGNGAMDRPSVAYNITVHEAELEKT